MLNSPAKVNLMSFKKWSTTFRQQSDPYRNYKATVKVKHLFQNGLYKK